MWATLALAAALQTVPAQPGAFALKNPRAIYGLLGQTRKDAKFLSGDLLVVTYDLQNLMVPEDSVVHYSLAIEVTSKADGKSIFKLDPQEFRAELTLGGTSRPATSFYEIPLDMAAGQYVFTLTGTDLKAKTTSKLEFPFEVLSKRLGFVQNGINLAIDQTLTPTSPMVPIGQTVIVGTHVVGFELGPKDEKDPKKQQPNIFIETRILDETGKQTVKPKTGGVTEVKEDIFKKVIPFTFRLELNRPGKYKIEMKVTDKYTNKTAEQTLDLTVFESK